MFKDSWHRLLHLLVVFARSASTHRRSFNKTTAKNLIRITKNPPRTIQINNGIDTHSNIHPPQLAKRITARRTPMRGRRCLRRSASSINIQQVIKRNRYIQRIRIHLAHPMQIQTSAAPYPIITGWGSQEYITCTHDHTAGPNSKKTSTCTTAEDVHRSCKCTVVTQINATNAPPTTATNFNTNNSSKITTKEQVSHQTKGASNW